MAHSIDDALMEVFREIDFKGDKEEISKYFREFIESNKYLFIHESHGTKNAICKSFIRGYEIGCFERSNPS